MIVIIARATIREGFAKKTMWILAGLSAFFLLIAVLLALFVSESSILPASPQNAALTPDQQRHMMDAMLNVLKLNFVGGFTFTALLLSIFATAGIFPSAIDKGHADLLLSKPISRSQLLIGKFLGAFLVIAVNAIAFIGCLWLILGLRLGDWRPDFLLTALPLMVSFLALYPVILLLGLLSRGSVLPMIVSYLWLFILDPILAARAALSELLHSTLVATILDGLYTVLPKFSGIGSLSSSIILGQPVEWMPLWSSLLFGAVLLVCTGILFQKKDL